jgi:hypothetical protein
MTADDGAKAREVHALLSLALPNRTDENLKKAADLLLADGSFQDEKPILLALQTMLAAIENGASAADSETMLRSATQEAALWVQRCSSPT